MPEIRTSPRSRLWPDRRRKPQLGTVEVDWDHPLIRGGPVYACLLFNEGGGVPKDLAKGYSTIVSGTPTWTASPMGLAVGATAITDYWNLVNSTATLGNLPTTSAPSCTIAMLRRKTDTTLRASAAFGWSSGGFGCHMPYSDGIVYWDFGGTGAPNRLTWSGYSVSTGIEAWVLVAGTKGSSIYFNGVQRANQGTALDPGTPTGSFYVNSGNGASGNGDRQEIALWMMIGREWGPGEVLAWSSASYAFLRPKVARRYSIPAAGGGAPQLIPVGQVTETDLAQAIARVKSRAVGQVAETDLAQVIARLKQRGLGQASEADIAQTIARLKQLGLGQPSEVDLAQALSRLKLRSLVQTSETDLGQAVGRIKRLTIGQAQEVDLALKITPHGGAGGGAGAGGSGILRTIRG